MSDEPSTRRETLAEAFDKEVDPLAESASTFEELAIDPFDLFIEEVIKPQNVAQNTLYQYRSTYNEWQTFMATVGRHPACPTEAHVRTYATKLTEKGNHPKTVKEKLRKLNAVYEYWQADPVFPHPQDYNPVRLAREKLSFETPEPKDFPWIGLEELRDRVQSVTHVRDQALIVMQVKLGLRASELCNVKLAELSVANTGVRNHYDEVGTHRVLDGRENAIYIPHDRENNKSRRPRVLPLDRETRQTLLRYLYIRPDNGEPWLFLSTDHHEQMGPQGINDIWKTAFHPAYAETETHRAVTSHYGRHYFTTFWRVHQDLNREFVKYMRGDTTGQSGTDGPPDGIGVYLHTYYEDIETRYRENIFELGLFQPTPASNCRESTD